jgi:uncharacterized RDD family membrane protein YckC
MSVPPWSPPPLTGAMLDDWLTRGVLTRRVLALLIDVLLIGTIVAVLGSGLFLFGLLTLGLGFPLLGLLSAVPPLYHFLFLASPLSATPGQALLGLVVRRDSDLGRPDVLEALVSVVGFYVTVVLGAVWLVVALLTTRRRTLHDLVSGLVVVRADALASLTPPLTPPGAAWNMPPGGFPHA